MTWKILREKKDSMLALARVVVFKHTRDDSWYNAHLARITSAFARTAGTIDLLVIANEDHRLFTIENNECKVILVEEVDRVHDIALIVCKNSNLEEKLAEEILEELTKRSEEQSNG